MGGRRIACPLEIDEGHPAEEPVAVVWVKVPPRSEKMTQKFFQIKLAFDRVPEQTDSFPAWRILMCPVSCQKSDLVKGVDRN